MLTSLLDRLRGYPGLEQVSLSVSARQAAARQLYGTLGFEVYGLERHALKVGDAYADEEHMMLWLQRPPNRGQGNEARREDYAPWGSASRSL